MGMSMKLGKSNAWTLSKSSDPSWGTCDISISSKVIKSIANTETTYEVTITINTLSARMNRRVDDGELYICLYERAKLSKGYSMNAEYPDAVYARKHNLTTGNKKWHYLQRVIRGKKDYVFNITLSRIDTKDSFYDYGWNTLGRVIQDKRRKGQDSTLYYIVGGCLLHIRNKKINLSGNNWFNKSLEESTENTNWFINNGAKYDYDNSQFFNQKFSHASAIRSTQTLKLVVV